MTPAQMLAEAEIAHHRLVTGTSVREVVDQNGEKVSYNVANAARLYAYIETLKKTVAGGTADVGPLRFIL